MFRMKQRITGDAEYVLSDAVRISSVCEFVDLLKERFGSEAHAERYRAELLRLRRGTMTLEQLHLRIHSLVSRAMPGQWNKVTEIYARDAFLTALDDDKLRRRIMMACPPPETLSAVFDLAVRASAIDESLGSPSQQESSWDKPQMRKRQKFTRVIAGQNYSNDESFDDVVGREEFQKLLEDQRKLLSEMEICRDRLQKAESALAAQSAESVADSASGRTTGMQRQKKQSRSIGFDVCRRCGVKGHWARECPMTIATSGQVAGGGNNPANRTGVNALTASNRPQVKVYVQIVYQGQFYRVLLDTGCDYQ